MLLEEGGEIGWVGDFEAGDGWMGCERWDSWVWVCCYDAVGCVFGHDEVGLWGKAGMLLCILDFVMSERLKATKGQSLKYECIVYSTLFP